MDRKTQKLEHGDRERKQQETSGQTTDGQETESQTMESRNMSSQEIEQHLKSALDALTPDVFEKLDLSVPQLRPQADRGQEKIITLQRRIRGMAAVAAACLYLVTAAGGVWHYQYQNRQIDSVIGIDVNPSVELSISRKNRILKAEPLNADARTIMEDMDLKGVELNVAVNAVIGSMVTHGYLDDLDNAILVTVSNDSVKKASALRTSVVEDIEQTLKENQVDAVVYDQQVIEADEVRSLADTYGISYGKAYFLKELIDQNRNLTQDDMKRLSTMNMEEIAREITKDSLSLGEFADEAKSSRDADTKPQETETPEATESSVETEPETLETSEKAEETTAEKTSAVETVAESQSELETEEEIRQGRVKIDYVDYEEGRIYIYFEDYVRWKNPTVSVRDEDGNSYAARIEETESDSCIVETDALEGGKTYSFVLGGITRKGDTTATTVKGYFDAPEIAEELKSSDAYKKNAENTDENTDEDENSRADAKTDTKSDAKADSGADVKAELKSDAKADSKADAKSDSEIQHSSEQSQKEKTETGHDAARESSTAKPDSQSDEENTAKGSVETGEENSSM